MKRIMLALALCCVVPVLGGCPLDSIFVRDHYIPSQMPYLPGYQLPAGTTPAGYWSSKEKFFRRLAVEADTLTPREADLVSHLYDYKDLMEQLDAEVREYNRTARESNVKNGYDKQTTPVK